MSLRRTALARKTELRRTPFVRKTPLAPARALRTQAAKARRDTGPSKEQRQDVYDRAWGCCEICGRRVLTDLNEPRASYSVHHRSARGMGGSSRPEINSPANLLLLCGDATDPKGCHAYVETNRAKAYDAGWLIYGSRDPATVPVLLEGSDWYLLTDAGDKVLHEGSED